MSKEDNSALEAAQEALSEAMPELLGKFEKYDELLDITRTSVLESDRDRCKESLLELMAVVREVIEPLKVIVEQHCP